MVYTSFGGVEKFPLKKMVHLEEPLSRSIFQKKNPRKKRKFRRAARGDKQRGGGKTGGKVFWFSYRRTKSRRMVFFAKFDYKSRRAERAEKF